MDRDVFALMALVGLLPILVDSHEKQLRRSSKQRQNSPNTWSVTVTEKYPENATSIFSVPGLAEVEYPALWRYVSCGC